MSNYAPKTQSSPSYTHPSEVGRCTSGTDDVSSFPVSTEVSNDSAQSSDTTCCSGVILVINITPPLGELFDPLYPCFLHSRLAADACTAPGQRALPPLRILGVSLSNQMRRPETCPACRGRTQCALSDQSNAVPTSYRRVQLARRTPSAPPCAPRSSAGPRMPSGSLCVAWRLRTASHADIGTEKWIVPGES